MKVATLQKWCERCGNRFTLPKAGRPRIRGIVIQYYPCTHCGFVSHEQKEADKQGRCIDCSVPFAIIDHHANGRCKRDDMRFRRQAPQK